MMKALNLVTVKILKALFFLTCFLSTTSFKETRGGYKFTISVKQIIDKIPKSITIQIVNNEQSEIRLNNLILVFYIDDEGLWGISDRNRFVNSDLVLKHKQKFNTIINFDSLTFTSFDNNKIISTYDLKKKIKNGKKISIQASINDLRRLKNPLESSSLTYSNTIELNNN